MDDNGYELYELYQRGTALPEAGHNHQATIPLTRARDLAPDKTSIREALGRALFHSQRYEQAATEFEAVIEARRRTTSLRLPGSLAANAGPPRRGAQAADARRMPAARPPRLPLLPRPDEGQRRPLGPGSHADPRKRALSHVVKRRAAPLAVLPSSSRLLCRTRPGGRLGRSWALARFFYELYDEENVNALQTKSKQPLGTADRPSRCCSLRSPARRCGCSSTTPRP